MGTTITMKKSATLRHLVTALVAGFTLLTIAQSVQAQEILVTGPLAGAPAVRKLRLYREGRFELAPSVSFTILDEYQRTILIGAKLNYNLTDWLAIGGWGAFGAIRISTALTDHIQEVVDSRACGANPTDLNCRLTATNLGSDFPSQVGRIAWVVAPQLTVVPFRGKIAIFESLYVDSDLHFFAGPAFVGLKERANCSIGECPTNFRLASRSTIAPTFGIGLSFFTHAWGALAADWRALPFSRNTGGFDTAGSGPDQAFPDNQISDADRQFRFNQLLTVSYSIFLPFENRVSE